MWRRAGEGKRELKANTAIAKELEMRKAKKCLQEE
jgi:hypothetical protein